MKICTIPSDCWAEFVSLMILFNSPAWTTTTQFIVVIISVAIVLIARLTLFLNKPKSWRKSIPSPRDTLLPFLTPSEVSALPYPPNVLPGARDVESPYGTMRCYEWGPEEGRKVILVHGDTTPAPMLGPIAVKLAERDCRVLVPGEWREWGKREKMVTTFSLPNGWLVFVFLLDLWGRGYSDTPTGLPHDDRLFSSQILIALASSPLSWTGASAGGFSIIGFSLGGGITMSFAAHFPYLIRSIILLAPSGIIRSLPSGYGSIFLRYSNIVPSSYLRRLVGNILGAKLGMESQFCSESKESPVHEAESQLSADSALGVKQSINVSSIMQWQFDNHRGFLHSFVNTSQHGPVWHQQPDWNKVCEIIKGEKTPPEHQSYHLQKSKILFIFGDADEIVIGKEIVKDFEQMLGGSEKVEFKVVPGNHGFPVLSSKEVVRHISDFWEAEKCCEERAVSRRK